MTIRGIKWAKGKNGETKEGLPETYELPVLAEHAATYSRNPRGAIIKHLESRFHWGVDDLDDGLDRVPF